MGTTWNSCLTPSCENDRFHPAALCSKCLIELDGGMPKEEPRLVQPVKTMKHIEEAAGNSVEQATMLAELAALRLEIQALKNEVKQSELKPPTHLHGLVPAGASMKLAANTEGVLAISPQQSAYLAPKYCMIVARESGAPHIRAEVFVTHVMVGNVDMLGIGLGDQVQISNDLFAFPGFPVDWAIISAIGLTRELVVGIRNPQLVELEIRAEVWGESMSQMPVREAPLSWKEFGYGPS